MHHPGAVLLSSRGVNEVKICSDYDQYGEHHLSEPRCMSHCAVFFRKLSASQLVAAICMTVQSKHANMLSRFLYETRSLITIGVSVLLSLELQHV